MFGPSLLNTINILLLHHLIALSMAGLDSDFLPQVTDVLFVLFASIALRMF
jgi:hypothetical protein